MDALRLDRGWSNASISERTDVNSFTASSKDQQFCDFASNLLVSSLHFFGGGPAEVGVSFIAGHGHFDKFVTILLQSMQVGTTAQGNGSGLQLQNLGELGGSNLLKQFPSWDIIHNQILHC